jgi:hypothetical protein
LGSTPGVPADAPTLISLLRFRSAGPFFGLRLTRIGVSLQGNSRPTRHKVSGTFRLGSPSPRSSGGPRPARRSRPGSFSPTSGSRGWAGAPTRSPAPGGADAGKCHLGSPTGRDPSGPVADRDPTLVLVRRLYRSSYVPYYVSWAWTGTSTAGGAPGSPRHREDSVGPIGTRPVAIA